MIRVHFKPFHKPIHALYALCLLGMLFGATKLNAADTTAMGSLEATAKGKVSGASTLGASKLTVGVAIDGSEAALNSSSINRDGDQERILRRANAASVFVGAGFGSRVDLNLGLHGTYESVNPSDRDQSFASSASGDDTSLETPAADWHGQFKETGFSGASIMARVKLLDWQGLTVSAAPFLESGVGSRANYSLTRSVKPKAGWLGIVSYGERGIGEVSANAGYRYRNPEEIDDVTLRNEIIYGASVTGYATRSIALFAAGQGRRLKVADNDNRDEESNRLKYYGVDSGNITGGLLVHLGSTDVSIYGGANTKRDNEFGAGRYLAGLSISTVISGNAQATRRSVAAEIDAKAAQSAQNEPKESWEPKVAAQPAPVEATKYSEMNATRIDPIRDLETSGVKVDSAPDDFDRIKARMATDAQAAKTRGPGYEEKADLELQALRDAEKKVDAEKAAKRAEEDNVARAERAKIQKLNAARLEKYRKGVQSNVNALPAVSEDVKWNGLE